MKYSYLWLLVFSLNFGFAQKTGSEISGDILSNALPISAFATTLFFRNQQKGTLQFAESMATSFVVTHSLKRIIDKPRPNGGRFSFPSGHTSSAFTGAAFLQRRYGWKIGLPSYLLASYVGYTRIKARKHDIYDVTAGAIVGVGSVYLFTKPYKNPNNTFSINKTNDTYWLNASFRIK
ncbi:phosphatase PAP2 family protein [Lacihabitans sp. LS3-19]|uniref:phosphatase PAP2 family protein n=1 Tax=Lacihabitans sp. LS3-19 TaxID=2487335 RepID=UPI0020CBB0B9|nr:phosphatase PAP2 family protein [Lacihabitans sp. LS3-19]